MNVYGILYIVFGLIYIVLCVLDAPEVKSKIKSKIRKYLANKFNLFEYQCPPPQIATPHIEISYPKIEKIVAQQILSERELYEFSIMYDNGVNILIENVKRQIADAIFDEIKKHNFIKYTVEDPMYNFSKRVYGELYVKNLNIN